MVLVCRVHVVVESVGGARVPHAVHGGVVYQLVNLERHVVWSS